MERKDFLLRSGGGDRLRIVDSTGDPRGQKGSSYRIVSDTPSLLILEKLPSLNGAPTSGRVLMAGEILSPTTVHDIVNVISASHWEGNLHVYGRDSHRVLTFDRGTLQHASSNLPEDRLNRLLVRQGFLTAAQVEEAMRSLRPPARLGRHLVGQGLLSKQELFELLTQQTEEIFFSALLESDGSYIFVVRDGNEIRPNTLSHLPIQELLLRGAERLDSVKEWKTFVPDLDLCPELLPGVEVTALDPKSRQILALSNGERSLREIATETWLGKYETMKITRDLVRRSCVQLVPQRHDTSEEIEGLVLSFNEVLRMIFSVVQESGDLAQTRDEVERWLAKGVVADILAPTLADDGSVDLRSEYADLSEISGAYLAADVRSALFQLTSFTLFAASMSIPTEVDRDLVREVYVKLHTMDV